MHCKCLQSGAGCKIGDVAWPCRCGFGYAWNGDAAIERVTDRILCLLFSSNHTPLDGIFLRLL